MIVTAGPVGAPGVLIVTAPFEEGARMRRCWRDVMRALAGHGIASVLPDWPGQNEDAADPATVRLAACRQAFADARAALSGPCIVASVRAGGVVDDAVPAAAGWWRLAPVPGEAALRAMRRADALGRRPGEAPPSDLIAGWPIAPAFADELEEAAPAPTTPLRVRQPAEVAGAPLWLRPEPEAHPAMAEAIAADLADWMRTCGVI